MEKNNINTREIVLKILYKINKEKAYSNLVLDNEIKKYNLDNRDINFITQIVYGTVTYLITIDHVISIHSNIKINKISDWVLNILRMSVYQIIYLDKIPKSAIVNEGVNLSKKYGHKAVSGFVNAVLKSINEDELDSLKFENKTDEISIKTSHEKWFVNNLVKEYGLEQAKQICEANNKIPPIYIRINTLKISFEDFCKLLDKDNILYKKAFVPNTIKLTKLHNVEKNELFKKGYFTIQDNAASLASYVLGPQENDNVLDLCSSPGGKTTHIAEMMNNKGKIIGCDIYENRLNLVIQNANRLGINIIETKINDGTKLNNEFVDKFDKVLVDAPCSGLGVIRRKVDIKYQKTESDLLEIQKIQYDILSNSAKYVKLNGYIVYSTCTILEEENEKTVERFLKENTNFEIVDISKMIPNNQANGKYIKTLPNINDLDGFFIAKLKRIN